MMYKSPLQVSPHFALLLAVAPHHTHWKAQTGAFLMISKNCQDVEKSLNHVVWT